MRMETKNFLCTNIPCFYFDTEYFFKSVAKAGFTQIELYLGTPHIFIDSRVIDDFNNIRKQAEKYQIKIAAVHPETMSFRYGLCYLDKTWNAASM